MSESESDKSEQATPFSLKRARDKGNVSRGLDLGFFTSLTAAALFFWISGEDFVHAFSLASSKAFVTGPNLAASQRSIFDLISYLFIYAARPILIFGACIFFIVAVFEVVQVGPVFSVTPLKPDFNRINPAKGLKRLLSWRMLVETAKSTIKLGLYTLIAWLVIASVVENNLPALATGSQVGGIVTASALKLVLFCCLAALAVAIMDQVLVRREFARKMRMSRRDVRREHRDQEGDARQKQKRKQLHVELSKLALSLRNVRGADVVLANPEHIAIALRYDPKTMSAPKIVTKSRGHVAQRVKALAFTYGVLIVEDKALARSLHRDGSLNQEIPETHFQAVADLYLRFKLTEEGAVKC